MKIAFFNYLPANYGGGLAGFYQQTCANLHNRHPSVTARIVSFDETAARIIQGMYSVFYARNEYMKPKGPITHPTAHTIPKLGELLSTYDIVYAKNDILDLTLLSMARITTTLPPVVIGFHTPVHYTKTPSIQAHAHNLLYGSLYYRSLLERASAFHVLNEFHEEKLRKGFPTMPIVRIHNPLDARRFRDLKQPHAGPLKVLWVGRLNKDKGCDDLIKLIKQERRRRVAWTVVGDGAMNNAITALAQKYPNVTYFPYMKNTQLPALYQLHDAFITTSKWECLPYTVLEAQHCGLPVLGYDIPGIADIVIPGVTGALSPSRYELSKQITYFKRSQYNRKTIRTKTVRRFNAEDTYRRLYDLFRAIHHEHQTLR